MTAPYPSTIEEIMKWGRALEYLTGPTLVNEDEPEHMERRRYITPPFLPPAVAKLDGFQHLDPDTVSGILSEAGRFFSEVIAPLNRIGDQQGSVLDENGQVRTPDGFKEAYRKFVEAGWAGAHIPEEYGGGGLPYTVGIVLQEMFKSANMAFSLCPLLTQAATALLESASHLMQENDEVALEHLDHAEDLLDAVYEIIDGEVDEE